MVKLMNANNNNTSIGHWTPWAYHGRSIYDIFPAIFFFKIPAPTVFAFWSLLNLC